MTNFHEIRFPVDISFGSGGGPERRTDIVTLGSGFEERNSPWADSRRRYNAGYGVRSLDDIHAVIAFFEARHGRLYGFRWKDWTDFKSCAPQATPAPTDQPLGIGDGTTTAFQLVKAYTSGAQSYTRTIRKPVAGSLLLAVDGVPQDAGAIGTLVEETGSFIFNVAPTPGESITAGFEFDVPVRFDSDTLDINLSAFNAGDIPAIPIVEVRLP